MRSLKFLITSALIALPALAFAQEPAPMRLSLSQGGVQIMSKDTSRAWEQAGVNTPIGVGDRLWLPEGARAEIQIMGGVYVRAEGDSSLDVLRSSADSVQFYTEGGHIYANNRHGGVNVVQIDTPLTSVRAYDGSAFLLDADDKATVVQVIKGDVYAENMQGQTRVAAGNALTINEDGSAEIAPIGEPDDWDRWNMERDKTVSAWGESTRYLPDGLQEYSSDFDNHGVWSYDNGYGYVWFPTVAAGWAPYRAGMWQWSAGNYVWVSTEPWGWAPYHYGRWLFITGRGWCWVPPGPNDVFWGPGYVGWVRTGALIGWVPLAPGEIYYGYCKCGPYSANIMHIDPKTVVVRRFANAEFPHGMTFVRRDTLGARERHFVTPSENPLIAGRFDFRPPRMEPGSGAVIGREAQFGQRPPERIMNGVRHERLMRERRLVREPGQSVFMERPRELKLHRIRRPKAVRRRSYEEKRQRP